MASKSTKSVAATKSTTKSVESNAPESAYRTGGAYHAVVAVLRTLGTGKFHTDAELVKAFPKAMGEQWKAFQSKEARNEDSGKDAKGRIIQNAIVVCRPDYGQALREIGWEVRKERGDDGYRFGLFKIGTKAAKVSKAAKSK